MTAQFKRQLAALVFSYEQQHLRSRISAAARTPYPAVICFPSAIRFRLGTCSPPGICHRLYCSPPGLSSGLTCSPPGICHGRTARQNFCQRIVTVRGLVLHQGKCMDWKYRNNPDANSVDALQCRGYSQYSPPGGEMLRPLAVSCGDGGPHLCFDAMNGAPPAALNNPSATSAHVWRRRPLLSGLPRCLAAII